MDHMSPEQAMNSMMHEIQQLRSQVTNLNQAAAAAAAAHSAPAAQPAPVQRAAAAMMPCKPDTFHDALTTNPTSWLFQLDSYFRHLASADHERLTYAAAQLRGAAMIW